MLRKRRTRIRALGSYLRQRRLRYYEPPADPLHWCDRCAGYRTGHTHVDLRFDVSEWVRGLAKAKAAMGSFDAALTRVRSVVYAPDRLPTQ